MSASSQYPRAFSVIEICVIISILGLAAAILLPVLRSAREQSRMTACGSNLRQVGMLTEAVLSDRDLFPFWVSNMPASPPAGRLAMGDVYGEGSLRAFSCPADPSRGDATYTSYHYEPGRRILRQIGHVPTPVAIRQVSTELRRGYSIIFRDRERWHPQRQRLIAVSPDWAVGPVRW